jgi:uncharacterized RDD family membrane protein YckC
MSEEKRGLRVVENGEEPRYPKASLFLRGGARLIDVAIAWSLSYATGPAGIVMALLYTLFADGMFGGQSPGKKIFGVKVIYLPTQSGARHRDSVLRNAPFGFIIILRMMPELGLQAFFAGLIVLGGIEALQCLRDTDGIRLGDVWAQTQVIDGKVAMDQPQRIPSDREAARATARFSQPPSPRRLEIHSGRAED